ncbi:uncharacterized protein LOC143342117 isoform X1 [Colletes latitarsis]|uniref:uncharacterized protein LOC143342117 isoform X1 n=1 Tax=Colletes latitarsis TaxID=2605962 RepID=UPI004035460E
MPQIQKHRKPKRARVVIKRSQCLRNFPTNKSYKPLCQKLRNNNNSLAKALSKEKQESQFLFSQNVALRAEVQDLGLECHKRDNAIVNILKNAKEMLKMLVTVTGYLTNTISSCQEFAASSTINLRMSCSSAGRRESYRRLSTKSPTKGVVKPMVSGHTITKPTISLSRINMRHINNPPNLSIIEEVSSPIGNQELNNLMSPIAVPAAQRRYENSHTCRMPERLTISPTRSSEENERRLSKRSSRHSGRISGRRSRPKSGRLSGRNSTRPSIDNLEHIGSPTVKLNDVSKFLQNSQSINIRMLAGTRNDQGSVSSESIDNINKNSQTNVILSETSPSDSTRDESDKNIENKNKIDHESDSMNDQTVENVNEVQNVTSNWEDPLEGPSWLFNDLQTVPCIMDKEKTDDVNVSTNGNTYLMLKATDTNDESDNDECSELISPLPILNKRRGQVNNDKKDKQLYNKNESTVYRQIENNENLCDTSMSATASTDAVENEHKNEGESTVSLSNFVTQRRGYFQNDDDDDDYTLMFVRQPHNMVFDIDDLKLPNLEESELKSVVPRELEPEVTTTLRKISHICTIPSISNNSLDESILSQSTVKLPLLINNDYDNKDQTQFNDSSQFLSRKKPGKVTMNNSTNELIDTSPLNKRSSSKKKKPLSKDPSSVKVVLQKLNESDVKSRTPSPEETIHNSNQSTSSVFSRLDLVSDSDSSSTSVSSTLNRPRRRRAPTSLQEPSLRNKLRRKF